MDIQALINSGISHSCYPNSGYNSKNELVAAHSLAAGIKITVDFSTLSLGGDVILHCNCGYVGCRKQIMGFEMLPVFTQEQYIRADMVPDYILEAMY